MGDYSWGDAWDDAVDFGEGLFGVGDTTKDSWGNTTDTRGWGDVTGDVLGAYAGYKSSQDATAAAAGTAASIRQADEEALKRAQPWDISGPTGVATFDPETQSGMMGLTPEMEAYRKIFMTRAPSHAAAIAPYSGDPFAASKALTDRERALYAEDEQRALEGVEKRLVAQGMFGSSGGAAQMGDARKALHMKNLQREQDNFKRVQALIGTYRGREIGDIEAASQIAAQPIKLAELGRGIGSGLTGVISTGMSNTSTALTNLGDTQAAGSKSRFWQGIF